MNGEGSRMQMSYDESLAGNGNICMQRMRATDSDCSSILTRCHANVRSM